MARRESQPQLVLCILCSCALAACGGKQSSDQGGETPHDAKHAAIDAQIQKRERELAAMDAQQLAVALKADSKIGLESFNSPAYRYATQEGRDAAFVEVLRLSATDPDRTSLLTVLAVRKLDSAVYRQFSTTFLTAVFVDALRSSATFNAWGVPHLYWTEAAEALAELPREITDPPLLELFDDRRRARIWGASLVAEVDEYQYRMCDYAWGIWKLSRSKNFEVPRDVKERDRLIALVPRGAPNRPGPVDVD